MKRANNVNHEKVKIIKCIKVYKSLPAFLDYLIFRFFVIINLFIFFYHIYKNV